MHAETTYTRLRRARLTLLLTRALEQSLGDPRGEGDTSVVCGRLDLVHVSCGHADAKMSLLAGVGWLASLDGHCRVCITFVTTMLATIDNVALMYYVSVTVMPW